MEKVSEKCNFCLLYTSHGFLHFGFYVQVLSEVLFAYKQSKNSLKAAWLVHWLSLIHILAEVYDTIPPREQQQNREHTVIDYAREAANRAFGDKEETES